ncbi:hypothetical protein A2U01_0049344, partial [Trifolium medium]|nr:hypothetical protein [Trifolium medium]
MDADGAE